MTLDEQVITAVAAEAGLRASDIIGKCRFPRIAKARACVSYILGKQGWSWSEIARVMGDADHSSASARASHYKERLLREQSARQFVTRVVIRMQAYWAQRDSNRPTYTAGTEAA